MICQAETPAQRAEEYRRRGWWRPQSITDLVLATGRAHPQRCAVVDGDRRLSFGELITAVETAAVRLHHVGIHRNRNDHVLVQLPNSLEHLITVLALIRLGAPPVLTLPALRDHELDHVLRRTQPVAMAVPLRSRRFDHLAMAERLRDRHPSVRTLLVAGLDPADSAGTDSHVDLTSLTLGDFPAGQQFASGPAPSDIALFLLSSGTTGLPKAIPRTHEAFGHVIRSSAEVSGLDESSVYLAVMPTSHSFAFSHPGILGALSRGGRIVLSSPEAPEHALALIEQERVTHCALVPALVRQWLAAAEAGEHDLSSLQVVQVGGARLDTETARRVHHRLSCTVQQVYGMSEGLLNFTRLDDPVDVIEGTQGRPSAAGDELLIVDDTGREVAPGATGELLTRGPTVLTGYYAEPESNARSFTTSGHYRTGDLVRQDAAGNLVVTGRIKDVINRGGEKVPADELEQILLQHPGIAAVAAVAMPHRLYGEAICLFVVSAGQQAPTIDELRRFLQERKVAPFKLPDRLELLTAMPMAGIGKVDKKVLRADIARRIAGERTGR